VITLLLGVAGLFVIAAGVLYFCSMMLLGWWETRRGPAKCSDDNNANIDLVVILIPCLNEERVISDTLRALKIELAGGVEPLVIVIDDGSDDRTSTFASTADPDVRVLKRELPNAKRGKGAALNHAFGYVDRELTHRRIDPTRVVICVLDADGRLSPGAMRSALSEFRNPLVGAVQLQVRIRNRESWLTEIQDLEFWGFSAMTQVARRRTGTVSLGGNGQFTRHASLQMLGAAPWSDALTEDLDLAVSMALRGWLISTVTDAHVDQQAVTTVRALMRQRTRWFQGHMTCSKRVPEILLSPKISSAGAIEMVAYLLIPFILTLPWSIIGQWALAVSLIRLYHGLQGKILGSGIALRLAFGMVWYLVGFFPTLTLAAIYRRRAGCTRRHAMALGHLLLAYNYLMYVAAWRGLSRMVRNRTGWAKTEHQEEPTPMPAIAA
jgi:1,2-diacylglycerol 3-beta-glucosyltransferase